MERTRNVYFFAMILGGMTLAFLGAASPAFRAFTVPPMLWLIVVALAFEAMVATVLKPYGFAPLTQGLRFAGIVSGAMVYLLADMMLQAGKTPVT